MAAPYVSYLKKELVRNIIYNVAAAARQGKGVAIYFLHVIIAMKNSKNKNKKKKKT